MVCTHITLNHIWAFVSPGFQISQPVHTQIPSHFRLIFFVYGTVFALFFIPSFFYNKTYEITLSRVIPGMSLPLILLASRYGS